MCTSITFQGNDFYFGRTLDLEYSYHETVTVLPRNFPLHFRKMPATARHHAIIGMAFVQDGYPLYYDAVNEKGLCAAGLNFPQNAFYAPVKEGAINVASFEFIPYLLASCATLDEARAVLARMNVADIPFSDAFPPSPLHWLVADKTGSVVVEPMRDGLHIHENPVGVLTNNPPFPSQLMMLNNYMGLSPHAPENTFAPGLSLDRYSRGMGALGLPGDWSSASRFARAAFVKCNCPAQKTVEADVTEFFHILAAVAMPRGSVEFNGKEDITVYTSCCDADRGVYYYTTYENSRIGAVDLFAEDLEGDGLIRYDLIKEQQIFRQNERRP